MEHHGMRMCEGSHTDTDTDTGVSCRVLPPQQIAAGMAHLHLNHKVAHRDLKSSNILCSTKELTDPGCIKINDFGFACAFTDASHDEFSDNCGTLE